MAGEFPDRSNQRESSAEPTSGSTGPVPEARDPRLAVTRDAEPPAGRGGVDTATRVFSARDVAKVRAAVAEAEGSGAEGSSGAGADASGAGEGREGAEDAPEDAAEAAAEGSEGSGADDSESVSEGGTDASGDAEGAEGAKTDPADDARLRAAVSAWVRTGDAAGTTDSGDGETAARDDSRTESEEPSESAVTEDGTAEATEPEDGTDAAGKADGDPEADAEAENGTAEATEPEDRTDGAGKADAEPEAEAGVEDSAEEADAGTEEGAAVESTPGTSTEADADAAEEGTDSPAVPPAKDAEDAEPEPDAPAPKPARQPDQPTRTLRAADVAAARKGRPETADEAADGEDASQASPAPGTEGDKRAAAPAAADGRDASQARPAPGGESREPATPAAADGKGGPQGQSAPGDESRKSATPAPAAADGEDAPQGPPAADDESRTGGAGGKNKAEGGAEASGVDQPTAMLKLPKPAAAKPETAPERTSKFVALKPDVTTPVPQVGPERTTQQPLPPKPPLDLLAELTNTPPPPETALRTTVRRVKIWTPLVLLLAVVFAVVQAVRPLPTPALQLTASDSYSFDGSKVDIPWPADGQAALDVQGIGSFGSSGEQKPVPIASVAKVMTAYVILRDHSLKSGAKGPDITIDQTAEDQSKAGQESTVDVTAGDKISQREALESILIASANNVARLLARWDAGSEKGFVEKMNAAAEDLGMTNTTYTDPSGLNDTTVSTAVDQVKLAKKAMEYPAFREVAAMMSYDDYKGTNHSNWNQLVGKNNVVGIKTGTTTSALGNLVFAAKKEVGGETRTIVGAIIRQPAGGPENTILSAALSGGDALIRAAQGALESATIIKKGDVVGYVDDGLGGHTPVVATKDVTAVGWSGLTVKLTFAGDDVPHTAKAGTQVGTLTVGDDSAGAVKVPVALQKDLVEPGFTDKLTRIA
ncbi:serine hydrolase [Streptomyces sp. NPDC046909]|uniref:serine hydrolase n=1 Tax=Streptomyces sp. NPDC046909 TaxID=3155617 RepID=UPI0033DC6ECF